MEFSELGINEKVLKAISELGYEQSTPIQEQVIPHIIADAGDLVALAQTGTGKTAAFGLPLLEKIKPEEKYTQVLILCPTRELCLQSYNFLVSYAKYLKKIKIVAVYGGVGIQQQISELKSGVHIIVATPGRLLDLMKRNIADISRINYFVLDEADIMLDMGFKDELDAIFVESGVHRQVLLFSATMPAEVAAIASGYMKNPAEIVIGGKNAGTDTIEHKYFMVHARDKYLALKRLVDFHPEIYGIIFCRTRISTQEIAEKMIKDGYDAEALHGDLSQVQREYVMQKFREKNIQLLIATDVAARGLDVDDLTHIIHYDLPDKSEIYSHRSGRTGRIGRKGISYAIINLKEKNKLKYIERFIKREITEAKVPGGREICEHQLMHLIDRAKTVKVDYEQIAPYMPVIEEKLASLDREELLQHFVSLEFNRFLTYYKNSKDLSPVLSRDNSRERSRDLSRDKSRDRNRDRSRDNSRDGRQRSSKNEDSTQFLDLSINLGKQDRITPPDLIGLINQSTRSRHIKIGRIDINMNTSRIQIEESSFNEVVEALDDFTFKNRKIQIKIEGNTRGKKNERKARTRRQAARKKKKKDSSYS
ncbi:MAG: DEAD/DEAH box helicase [Spirochaetales bacterium]|nr:DEAD/DEAH box helicase [Spirochaetales bacterium]